MVDFFIRCFLLVSVSVIGVLLGLIIWGIWILAEILDRIQDNKINPWIDRHFGESKEK